jgi:serine/threonine protein kinase
MNPREAEFQKKNKLGSGAFGVVWQVQRRSDGEHFALKEIDLRKPGLQQVMKEVETMMQLPPHPNIVRLYAHWMSDDRKDMWLLLQYAPVLPALYICNILRRYCSEGNLAQFLLSTVRLPDAALLDLAGQLLRALCVFEQHRIVHNDIKPDNIFVMAGSVPKIGDLGMARFTSAGSVLTRTPGGTPWFQAPEVLSKEMGADGRPICFPEYVACEISYQSDVYSLGAVMWSLIMRRNPDRPGGAFPLTPALVSDSGLRELVNDMLQSDPAKRQRASHLILRFPPAHAYASAPALAHATAHATAPAPAPAPAPGLISRCLSFFAAPAPAPVPALDCYAAPGKHVVSAAPQPAASTSALTRPPPSYSATRASSTPALTFATSMDRLTFMMAIRALVLMPGLKLLQATPAMLKWRTHMLGEVIA